MDGQTELVFESRWKSAEIRVPLGCTGKHVYEAIAAATGIDYIHQLYALDDKRQLVPIVPVDQAVEPPLANRQVIVAQENLIVWLMHKPEEEFDVLHLWPGDMPSFLSNKEIFPQGAFTRNGARIDPEQQWFDGIVQVYSLPLHKRPSDGEWKGPRVCACNRLNAPPKCPYAWDRKPE